MQPIATYVRWLCAIAGIALILVLPIVAFSANVSAHPAKPTVEIAACLRQANWSSEGSCAHAAFVNCLRQQGRSETAENWRQTHSGGVMPWEMHAAIDAAGLRYATTMGGNHVAFLYQAIATHRACLVGIRGFTQSGQHWPGHAVVLVSIDRQFAGLIDVNTPADVQWWPLTSFLREWQLAGSWALTPVYSPYPPAPTYRPQAAEGHVALD